MMKKIYVDQKNVKKFYRILPFYRTFLFKKCTFKIESSLDGINSIETALNIKNKKKRLNFVYDEICRILDEHASLIDNLCGFEGGRCHAQRAINSNSTNGCCRLCRFQSFNGCTTKNVACKLYFCEEVRDRYKVLEMKDIMITRLLSKKQRILIKSDYFSTREEVLSDLSSMSLLFTILKIFKRNTKTYIRRMISK